MARRLAQLLVHVDSETLTSVVQLLGIKELLHDVEFARSCERYIEIGDEAALAGLEREIAADPGRATLAVEQLEVLPLPVLEQRRRLLEVIAEHGSASAVISAGHLLTRLDSVEGELSGDPLEVAEQLVLAAADGVLAEAHLWQGIVNMWNERRHGDPLDHAANWLDTLVVTEDIHRRAERVCELPQSAVDARASLIGWLSSALPSETFEQPAVQELRVVLDLLMGKSSEVVLDGLHQLAVLADNAPGGEGDSAWFYALVTVYARRANVASRIVERSRTRLAESARRDARPSTRRFIDAWVQLARLSTGDLQRALETV